jgi:hypothetical protein
MAPSIVHPEAFARAVATLCTVSVRDEILLEELAAPQRLAPYAYALGGTVCRGEDEAATGRLILLYDPAGHPTWQGTHRLVTYVTAQIEPELASDPLLPTVGWSWLTDALRENDARYRVIGGTVTQTISSRFADLAGPPSEADLEIRASWTPADGDLGPHLLAWSGLLGSAAGLPPPGVSALPSAYVGPGRR